MESKQYFISTKDGKIAVTGYLVVIPGYEEFSFFVHRPREYNKGKNSPPCFNNKRWVVSEEITGLGVSPSSFADSMRDSTRAGALAIVVERFKSMGREHILPILKTAIERTQPI